MFAELPDGVDDADIPLSLANGDNVEWITGAWSERSGGDVLGDPPWLVGADLISPLYAAGWPIPPAPCPISFPLA